jgi:hypothetical protein
MTRVYLAGPMTGLPELNFPAFHDAAARLRAHGYEVVSPAEVNPEPDLEWAVCLRRDIPHLCTCDVIALLPGWEKSRGAKLELHIADALGMRRIYVDHFAVRGVEA